MSQFVRNNPGLAEQGIGYEDVAAELADREKRREQHYGPDIDRYEGRRRAIQDRYEREYDRLGPSPEERVNTGQGRYE